MSDVKIRLRFYLPHDIDLISLMITHQMDIVQAMYCAISSFVKHESFAIKLPSLRDVPMEKKRVFHRNLSLDLKRDKAVIELLERIEPGYRNNFLKNILRLYLFCPVTEAFLTDPNDMELFEDYCQVFTEGKRKADAAAIKPKKRTKVVESKNECSRPHIDQVKEDIMLLKPEKESSKKEIVEEITMPEEELDFLDIVDDTSEDLTDLFTGLLG